MNWDDPSPDDEDAINEEWQQEQHAQEDVFYEEEEIENKQINNNENIIQTITPTQQTQQTPKIDIIPLPTKKAKATISKPTYSYKESPSIYSTNKDTNIDDLIKLKTIKENKKSSKSSSLTAYINQSKLLHTIPTTLLPSCCYTSPSLYHDTPPRDCTYIPYTHSDGRVSYLKHALSDPTSTNMHDKTNKTIDITSQPLLQQSITKLAEEALKHEINLQYHKNLIAKTPTPPPTPHTLNTKGQNYDPSFTSNLWVEKYKPKSFTQLLSPENINREVLRSLKEWDRFVYKTKKSLIDVKHMMYNNTNTCTNNKSSLKYNNKSNSTSNLPSAAAATHSDVDAEGSGHRGDGDTDAALRLMNEADSAAATQSKDTRPFHKVILLSGPPGECLYSLYIYHIIMLYICVY